MLRFNNIVLGTTVITDEIANAVRKRLILQDKMVRKVILDCITNNGHSGNLFDKLRHDCSNYDQLSASGLAEELNLSRYAYRYLVKGLLLELFIDRIPDILVSVAKEIKTPMTANNKALQAKVNQLETIKASLEDALEESESKLQAVTNVTDFNALLSDIELEFASKTASMSAEISNLKVKNAELEAIVADLKIENKQLKATIVELKAENKELKATVAAHNVTIADLKATVAEQNVKIEVLMKENRELDIMYSDLYDKFDKMTYENNKRFEALEMRVRDIEQRHARTFELLRRIYGGPEFSEERVEDTIVHEDSAADVCFQIDNVFGLYTGLMRDISGQDVREAKELLEDLLEHGRNIVYILDYILKRKFLDVDTTLRIWEQAIFRHSIL